MARQTITKDGRRKETCFALDDKQRRMLICPDEKDDNNLVDFLISQAGRGDRAVFSARTDSEG